MRASAKVYDSARLAAGYAFDRPPVHEHVLRHLPLAQPARRALDIGCGAGLSTAALTGRAETIVGLEPMRAMLAHTAQIAPNATFLVGSAERLPFADNSFDLITAAGALNYADPDRYLPEISRVLTPGGKLVVYDFSGGERARNTEALASWFKKFITRYPFEPGYFMDVRALPLKSAGLQLENFTSFEAVLPMSHADFVRYAMSETNVEQAIAQGAPESPIAQWCAETLAPVFAAGLIDVVFDAQLAVIEPG